ncbi:MAG: adenylate/guanylate cyclase domain-containing protein [Bdellovibrionota bacterium]
MKLKKYFFKLIELTAFKLGIIICIAFYIVSNRYYRIKDASLMKYQDDLSVHAILENFHQRSVDLKLLARGPEERDSKLAILAIDEKSVEKFGRWPWSRTIIAEAIEKIFEHDAAVLAFDVIFSEPDNNQAIRSLNKLAKQTNLSEEQKLFVEKELIEANSDIRLAQAIEKYSDRIIMGTYFDNLMFNLDTYQEKCAQIAFSKTKESEFLSQEDIPMAALDQVEIDLPESLYDFLDETFDEITAELDEKKSFEKNSDRLQAIRQSHLEYCAKWLYEDHDPYLEKLKETWPEIAEEEELELSFEEWKNELLQNSAQNLVNMSGRLWMNIPMISEKAKHTAYFNAFQDPDGTIRKNHLVYRYGNTYMPAMGLKAVMVAKRNGVLINVERNPYNYFLKGVKEITFTDQDGSPTTRIPVDFEGALPINYSGPQKMFAYLSISELFNGKDTMIIEQRKNSRVEEIEVNKAEFIKDRIFLVGATATGIYDLRVTPFEENFPGPETHVNIMDNLLRGDFLKNHQDEPPYMLGFILISGLLLSFAISQLGALSGLLVSIALIGGMIYLDFLLLFSQGIVVSIILPLLLFSFLYVSLTFFKYFTEEKKKKELKGTFQKYVSPAIVDEVLKDPENIQLGGRKERMTVLFSDIRGFTTISEQLDPSALSDLLNSYLTPMTDLVFANKGTLDKYMGDAVMAFFGAPISYPNHASMGVKCALEMLEKLKELQAQYKEQGLPDIDVGIGLNTGDMSVGNMGSETVRSYTVMGDAVNLGSRLEGINKQYGTRIIISEFTYQDILESNLYVCREIDWVKVKGKLEPVKIYEVVNFQSKISDDKLKCVNKFKEAFELYHEKRFSEAIEILKEALSIDPEDGPSLLYMERTENYLQNPPPEDWDGVFTMTTK